MCDIKEIKNLACATKEEQIQFFGSFDYVFSDLDGVIWVGYNVLSGAGDCINNLKKLGKSVSFITNNTSSTPETVANILLKNEFLIKQEDIITPTFAIINYLKELNFSKTIFVIGTGILKEALNKAGFKIAENPLYPIDETVKDIATNIVDDDEIGAVIVDVDVNLTYIKLQKAVTYLKRKNCLFITGAGDKTLPFPNIGPLIGSHFFIEAVKCLSGKQPQQMAKPSVDFSNYINQKLSITSPQRVLFIGDSIEDDMKFAANSGYQKLIVLSGITKKEQLVNWTHDENVKPQYYVESMKALNLILGMLQVKH